MARERREEIVDAFILLVAERADLVHQHRENGIATSAIVTGRSDRNGHTRRRAATPMVSLSDIRRRLDGLDGTNSDNQTCRWGASDAMRAESKPPTQPE